MLRSALLPALLATLVCGCLSARGTAERPLVRSFEIHGTGAVSASDIRDHLATQASSRFLFFRQDLHYYDPDALANDAKRIERYYRAQGYYQARVADVEVRPAGEGTVDIAIQVTEGEPVRVREVSIAGLESAPNVTVPRLPVRPGQVFTEARFDSGNAALLTALHNSGYARAEVAQQANIDSARTSVRVVYMVKPGDLYRFGNVFVAGTVAVPRPRVRQEAESLIVPGAVFDESLLSRAQGRVFDLGVFGGVRVTQGTPDPEAKTIPVVVAVREAPFHTIRAGPGVGLQASSRLDAQLVAGWTDRNWLGGLRKLKIDGRLGYAWLLQDPKVDGWVADLTADFLQPGVIARAIDLGLRVEVERGLEQAYSFWAERVRVGFPLRVSRAWTLVPSYNVETYQLSGHPEQLTGAQTTTSQLFLASCPPGRCVLSYFEQTVAWDGRDNPLEPRSGAYLGLSLQEGFHVLGYGFQYVRLLPEGRAFLPLGRRSVLAARLRFGFLLPLAGDRSPIVARFTSGGPNSMRGYYSGRLSPILEGTTLPVGGDSLADGSLELRFPLSQALEAALFLDAGNVGVSSGDALNLRQWQYALGIGLRYRTPFGPLRIDLAANLPKLEDGRWVRTGVPVVAAEPGGAISPTGQVHHDTIFAFHFSIGEAF